MWVWSQSAYPVAGVCISGAWVGCVGLVGVGVGCVIGCGVVWLKCELVVMVGGGAWVGCVGWGTSSRPSPL